MKPPAGVENAQAGVPMFASRAEGVLEELGPAERDTRCPVLPMGVRTAGLEAWGAVLSAAAALPAHLTGSEISFHSPLKSKLP